MPDPARRICNSVEITLFKNVMACIVFEHFISSSSSHHHHRHAHHGLCCVISLQCHHIPLSPSLTSDLISTVSMIIIIIIIIIRIIIATLLTPSTVTCTGLVIRGSLNHVSACNLGKPSVGLIFLRSFAKARVTCHHSFCSQVARLKASIH